MIYIPGFIKTGSRIQKFMGVVYTQIHRQNADGISLRLFFFQNMESRLIEKQTIE
jgi:hypothetical protein